MPDPIVLAHPNGRDYVMVDDDGGEWWVWPAEQDGWRHRQRWHGEHGDDLDELPPKLARLALRLSGAADD